MKSLTDHIFDIVKSSNGCIFGSDEFGPYARKLIELESNYVWKEIMHCITKVSLNTPANTICYILYAAQDILSDIEVIIDIAFDYEVYDDGRLLFSKALRFAVKSENYYGSYFLSRLVYDDKAKFHLAQYGHLLTELILKLAYKCTLYELKVLKSWFPKVQVTTCKICNSYCDQFNDDGLKELTRCIEMFAGIKYVVDFKDIMIMTQ
jgi:hypothetical protein